MLIVVGHVIVLIYTMYMHRQTSKNYCSDVDCQICALLMHGVPVMALTATATHDMMESVALALGMYQCTVVKRSCNQPNVCYEVQRMQSFAEEEFEK